MSMDLKKFIKESVQKMHNENKRRLNEARFFDFILQGSDATKENAYDAARGLDWMEMETKEATYPYLNYIDTINGVGIWYNYGADSYYFTDEAIEEGKSCLNEGEETGEKQYQKNVYEGYEGDLQEVAKNLSEACQKLETAILKQESYNKKLPEVNERVDEGKKAKKILIDIYKEVKSAKLNTERKIYN